MKSFILINFFFKNEIIPLKMLWIGSELKDNQKFNTSGNRTQLKNYSKIAKKASTKLSQSKSRTKQISRVGY